MNDARKQLYGEREKRIVDAIALREPDRVPVVPLFAFFNCYYAAITPGEAYKEPDKAIQAWRKTILDFEPDATYSVNFTVYAMDEVLSALDFKAMKWPGHGVAENRSFQFVENEYMRAEEYDQVLENPGEYLFRTVLPRLAGNLAGLSKLPPFETICLGYAWPSVLPGFANPEVISALETILDGAKKQLQWVRRFSEFAEELKGLGFPSIKEQTVFAPYDMIADNLRGTRGAMTDLYRRPGKLKRAVEQITPFIISAAINGARAKGNPRVFIPLHKGTDELMSPAHFKEFYWPTLQRVIVELCEAGCTPYLLIEGAYNSRLEIIGEVPKGKCLYHFERTDIFEAKKKLGDTVCLMGNVPNSLLVTAKPDDIKEYCKKLIDVCGDGGGFIMSSSALIDEAKVENVRTMIEFTREYGRYHTPKGSTPCSSSQ
jgi:hypothetical protein